MDQVVTALTAHYGFDGFRPGQRDVIDAIVEGRPVVAVMPTGAGKSLCYQLPAMLLDGLTVVVSPLIALMKDQVDGLRDKGIPAGFVNSTMDATEQRATLEAAASGRLKLLYVAPERFRFAGAMAALKRMAISLFAVDEAHCISQWGHDFRPDYKNLGWAARQLGVQRIAAFTATATSRVRSDIVESLQLEDPLVTVAGFLRENLHFSVVAIKKMREKPRHASAIIRAAGGSSIVYCATRKHCLSAALDLTRLGHEVVVYHGGLPDEERKRAQEAFQARDDLVIVATNAFGMGVDKPNVRAVIHWDIPGSLAAYYQEAGRAGRDSQPAVCVLLFTYADTRIQEFFIDNSGEGLPADVRAALAEGERQKLRAMVRYAYEEGCRHSAILRYFGEWRDDGAACPGCDRCNQGGIGLEGVSLSASAPVSGLTSPEQRAPRVDPRPLTEDEEIVVQKVLSAVARARGHSATRTIARVLRGSKSKDVLASPLLASKSYGILKTMNVGTLSEVIGALGRAGCTSGRHPRLTPLGVEVMWRRASVQLDVPPFGEKKPKRKTERSALSPEPMTAEERELLARLKQRRIQEAQQRSVPAYVVASNRVLEQIVRLPPEADRDLWLAIRGVGDATVDPLIEVFRPILGS